MVDGVCPEGCPGTQHCAGQARDFLCVTRQRFLVGWGEFSTGSGMTYGHPGFLYSGELALGVAGKT